MVRRMEQMEKALAAQRKEAEKALAAQKEAEKALAEKMENALAAQRKEAAQRKKATQEKNEIQKKLDKAMLKLKKKDATVGKALTNMGAFLNSSTLRDDLESRLGDTSTLTVNELKEPMKEHRVVTNSLTIADKLLATSMRPAVRRLVGRLEVGFRTH